MKKSILFVLISLFICFSFTLHAMEHKKGDSGNMHMHSMTPVTKLKQADSPQYPVGTRVILLADHMPDMVNARGKVSGAYDTTVYAVDFVNAKTGEKMDNHKWVIQEEIVGSTALPYRVGDKVRLTSGHISSMGGEGAVATISEVVRGPVYMVDYFPTDGGAEVKNHQWVTGSELKKEGK